MGCSQFLVALEREAEYNRESDRARKTHPPEKGEDDESGITKEEF